MNRRRLTLIDAARLLSILLVMFHHFNNARAYPLSSLPGWWLTLASRGEFGVRIFFVLSGFVITRSICQEADPPGHLSVRGFYARRVARILPLLLFVLCLGGVGLWLFPGPSQPRSVLRFCLRGTASLGAAFWLSVATFTFNWRKAYLGPQSHGLHWDVLWSLSVEEQFYLIYPLLLRRLRTGQNLGRFLLLVLCVCLLARIVATSLIDDIPGLRMLTWFSSSLGAFDLMAMGGLLSLLLDRAKEVERSVWTDTLIGALGGVGFVATYYLHPDLRVGPLLLSACFCLFLYGGLRRGWLAEGPVGAALAYLGRLSYAAYLLHAAALLLIWPLLQLVPPLHGIAAFTVLTFFLSAAAHHLLELPANRRIRALLAPPSR